MIPNGSGCPLHLSVVLALLAACSQGAEWEIVWKGEGSGRNMGILEVSDGQGTLRFARRVDGSVAHAAWLAPGRSERRLLVVMGGAGGVDQSKLLVLDTRGETVAQYRNPGFCPWDEPAMRARPSEGGFRQRQDPKPEMLVPFEYAGRRFLAVGMHGVFKAPCVFVVLEVGPKGGLEECLVFWNNGTIHKVLVAPKHIAVLGWNNHLRDEERRSRAIAVFRIEDCLRSRTATDPARGQSPDRGTVRRLKGAPYFAYVATPGDDVAGDQGDDWDTASFEGRRLVARMRTGLEYVLDLTTADVEVGAQGPYVTLHGRVREKNPDLPGLESHLARLRDLTDIWTGTQ